MGWYLPVNLTRGSKLFTLSFFFLETWGYDLNYYAKIFNFAAIYGIRLVGLNVPIQVIYLLFFSIIMIFLK